MIELKDISKTLKNKRILSEINLRMEKGNVYLLKGHNGCGKTMLLRMLCGLVSPDEGEVILKEKYLFGVVIETIKFMENETALYNMKYLAGIRNVIQVEDIEMWLKALGLYEVKDNKVKTFSLGMKQRLGICQAVMENQDIILLDEPFNALDAENFERVKRLIKELKAQNKMIVVAAHGLSKEFEEELFDEVFVMNEGRIHGTYRNGNA